MASPTQLCCMGEATLAAATTPSRGRDLINGVYHLEKRLSRIWLYLLRHLQRLCGNVVYYQRYLPAAGSKLRRSGCIQLMRHERECDQSAVRLKR